MSAGGAVVAERLTEFPGSGGLMNPSLTRVYNSANPVEFTSDASLVRDWTGMRTGHDAEIGIERILFAAVLPTVAVLTLTPDDFYQKILAPWQIVDMKKTKIQWSTTTFEPGMAGPVPELGIVRLLRTKTEAFETQLERVGIGFSLESDFMETEVGRQTYLAHILQMSNSVSDLAKLDCMQTLLNQRSANLNELRKRNIYQGISPDEIVAENASMFAAIQKFERNPMETLDTYVTEKQTLMQGKGDTWIVPSEVFAMLNLTKPAYTDYSIAGPAGPERLKRPASEPSGFLPGSQVFAARRFTITSDERPVHPLSQRAEIGEYVLSDDPDMRPHGMPYHSAERSRKLFNQNSGKFEPLGMEQLVYLSHLFDPTTKKPRYTSDPGWKYVEPQDSNPEADERRNLDIFNYKTANGQTRTAKYAGEIQLNYITPSDKVQWGVSLLHAIKESFGEKRWNSVSKDISSGLELINTINSLPFDAAIQAELLATFNFVAAPNPRSDNTSLLSYSSVKESEQEESTGFLTRKKDLEQLLPGLGSFNGLKFISINADAATLGREKKIARDFVRSVEEMVSKLRDIIPTSIFLNQANASPWWFYPSAATNFVENVLLGVVNPPLFVTTDKWNAGAEVDTPETKTAQFASRFNRYAVETLQIANPARLRPYQTNDADSQSALVAAIQIAFYGAVGMTALTPAERNNFWGPGVLNINGVDYPTWTIIQGNLSLGQARQTMIENVTKLLANNPVIKGLDVPIFADKIINIVQNIYDPVFEKNPVRAVSWSDYVRTPLLASATMAATIFNSITAAGGADVVFLPADPDFPELPIAVEKLDRYTRHLSQRKGIDYEEQRRNSVPEHLLTLPAWTSAFVGASSGGSTHIVNTPLAHTLISHKVGIKASSSDYSYSGVQSMSSMPIGAPSAADIQLPGTEQRGSKMDEIVSRRVQALQVGAKIQGKLPYASYVGTIGNKTGDLARIFTGSFVNSWMKIGQLTQNGLERAFARLWDSTELDLDQWRAMIVKDVRIPLNFLILRLHIVLGVWAAIKMFAGRETALTFAKKGSFQVGRDPQTQAFLGTLTWHSRVSILRPQNVYVVPALGVNKIHSGMDLTPIRPEHYNGGSGRDWRGSIIVLPMLKTERPGRVFSAVGEFSSLPEFSGLKVRQFSTNYVCLSRAQKTWGWSSARSTAINYNSKQDGYEPVKYPNVVAMRATYLQPDPKTLEWTWVSLGDGHLQHLIYPNCLSALNGLNVPIDYKPWVGQYTFI